MSIRNFAREHAVVLVVVLVVVVMPAAAIAYDLSNTTPTSGTIPVETQSGTTVYVANTGGEMNLKDPWVDKNTVRIATAPTAGNATVTGSGGGNITLWQTTGTETKLTGIDASTTEIKVNPEDKRAINVTGGIDTLNYTANPTIDDSTTDFTYSASSSGDVVVRGVKSNTDIRAVDKATGSNVGGGTSDANGKLRINSLDSVSSSTDVILKSSSGGPGLSNPSPEGTQSDFPSEMTVDVSDPDFSDGESVTVEFFIDGTSQGTTTVTSEGTATLSIPDPSRGNHTAKAVATDSAGFQNTINYDFAVPQTLFINRATDPGTRIDDRRVNVAFREGGEVYTRSTTNGQVSLTGLPVEGDIVGSVSAESTTTPDRSYHDSEIIVQDIAIPETIYLLDTNATSVQTRFTLADRTSEFDGNGAQLIIQFVDNSSGTPQYEAYLGDEFGVSGVTTQLVKSERYRLLVRNDDGDKRVLGTYDADVGETVQLTVGSVSAKPAAPDVGYGHNATYMNNTGQNYVRFEYNDSAELTDTVTLEIYQRGNRSNKLVDNQTFSGPLGTLAITEPVPNATSNSTWVVLATVDRDGRTFQIRSLVGPRNPILTSLAPWMRAIISIGSIFLVAALFSRLNGAIGGLVVAGLGGIWFYVDFLPQETGIGVVILSMVTAAVIYINGRRA